MKITTFNPQIITKNAEPIVKATPHRTCAEDAPTDFPSDCIEIPQAY